MLQHRIGQTKFLLAHNFAEPANHDGLQVVAVDTDAARLELVAHNASIYGVQHRVELVCADFFQVAPRLMVRPHSFALLCCRQHVLC